MDSGRGPGKGVAMNLKGLNVKYALANIGFMALASGSIGFAYNYLSQSGFDDGTVGTVMSLVSLLGIVLGPAAADLVDHSQRLTQKTFITASMVVCGVFAAILLLIPQGAFLILPTVIISFMCTGISTPQLNSMAFIYEKSGARINYGLCRGLGSAGFAVGSFFMGQIWAQYGRNTLPVWVVASAVFTIVALQLMPSVPKQHAEEEARDKSISMFKFFGKYKRVTVMAFALVLMFFCHSLIQNFMAIVIGTFDSANVEGVQGTALLIQAMAELPTMLCFAFLMKKFGLFRILYIASIMFSIKHVLVLFCGSVPMFYGITALQMFSMGAILPATVYLSNELVNEADQNKGQAIFVTASTVVALLANFLGGWMFTFLDVKPVLIIGVVASAIGTAVMISALRSDPSHQRTRVES